MSTRIDYGISSHILMHSSCPPNASKVERISTKAITGDKAQHLEVCEGVCDHLEGVLVATMQHGVELQQYSN